MTDPIDGTRRRGPVLAVLCLSVLVINMDAMIVNVALPSLVEQLDATTSDLQWIADAYSLTFAALVIAAGSLSDRFGRREALVAGLALFTLSSGLGAFSRTAGELITARAVMGLGAALIYPATLSILTTVYVERRERARAIGAWGAVSGIGIVLGPLVGGVLLEHFWWGSILLVMAPVGLLALALTAAWVPTSRDPAAPPLDLPGLVLSSATVAVAVHTLIAAPHDGWLGTGTASGLALTVALGAALLAHERGTRHPMLDLALFRDRRFTGACGAMTAAFFTLYGFIFVITQYLQLVRGYSPGETGLRFAPVAVGMVAGSVVGGRLAITWGTRLVVTSGIVTLGVVYLWFASQSATTGYGVLAAQLALVGLGLGVVGVPATEAIMRAVPPAKASMGSALNDATRLLGGTLGVAIVGSLFQTVYAHRLQRAEDVTGETLHRAQESIGAAAREVGQLTIAGRPAQASSLESAAVESFLHSFQLACLVLAAISIVTALVAWVSMPSRREDRDPTSA